ncbi:MAG: UnbV [Planctomycetota bacterium]|nr:UnbV [Planctomycetota bacterium]
MNRARILSGLVTAGLFVCLSAAGCSPTPVAKVVAEPVAPKAVDPINKLSLPSVTFRDITAESGLSFTHHNGMTGEKLLPETMGSGVAFLDYDNDGDQDLFLVNSCPWPGKGEEKPTQRLYQNDGKGHFKDVTKEAGLDKTYFGMGVAVGDYDNDGDPDLYVTAVGGGHLYRNDGGKFVDVTDASHAKASDGWLTSAAFFDMENDGDLDLFVCSYVAWSPEFDKAQSFNLAGVGRSFGPPNAFRGAFCILLRNDGGKFADVSEEAGIRIRKAELKDPMAKALGVAPCDVDGDGLVDLAVANDTVPNFLFHNLGKGRFEEVGITAGIAFDQAGSPRGAMGTDWGDFRNDNSLGLAVANFANEMIALYVADTPKDMQFSDMAPYYGLGAPTQPPLKFGLFFFDFDLDGRLDLLSANGHLEPDVSKVQASEQYAQSAQLYWNTGRKGREMFALLREREAGEDLFKPVVGRGSTYADIDGDGDLDVVLTVNGGPMRLLRNDGGNANRWIRLNLRGNGSNRDAIGARVVLKSGEITQRRQLFPAKGYLSSVEKALTFGLGKAETADSVEITWPSGKVTKRGPLTAGKAYLIDEADGVK